MRRNFEPWDRETIANIIEGSFRPYPNALIGAILCQVYDELLAAEAMVALLQAKLTALQPAASVVSGWVSDGANPPTTLTVSGTGDSSVSSDTVVGGTITNATGLVWTDANGKLFFGDKVVT